MLQDLKQEIMLEERHSNLHSFNESCRGSMHEMREDQLQSSVLLLDDLH